MFNHATHLEKEAPLIGSVVGIYRYPVKSMQGESLQQCPITWHGLVGDHAYAVTRYMDGVVLTAKRKDGQKLLMCHSTFDQFETQITIPGGAARSVSSRELADELSYFLSLFVEIKEAASHSETYHKTNADLALRPGVFFDNSPIHILTTASIAMLAQYGNEGEIIRRFRPNLVVDTGNQTSYLENTWSGRCLSFGSRAELYIRKPAERCLQPCVPQPGLGNNPQLLREITLHNDATLGVYAAVITTGTISRGDTVEWCS